ncbi:EAL domain-containing protein [Achromobacter sp. AONIH1]|uniref:EAL domain-containing protein n=1 Tax=unclassified Achromobacter TaxID=2626865 RepID=UPI001319E22B|nr:EAL domain-containing protein [Achromobacter sp. AONIH1]
MLVAAVVPTFMGIALLDYFAFERAKNQAQTVSKAVLKRADDVLTQLWEVSRTLGDMGNSPPCASFARAEMGKLVLQSPLLRAIAVLDGSRVACSSLGHSMDKVDIGQPDFVSVRGVKVWSDVVLPAAPNLHYSALADGGYAIFLNRGDFLGAAELLAPHMTLGLAYPGTAAQFLGSGNVDPAWMEGLEDRVPVTEERAGAVVALTPSSKFSFFAMATLPKHAYLHDMALTRWIVGVTGALAGLLVFTVIFWQSRRALDLRTQLQRAIQNRDFYLAYQPIVDLRSGAWVGAEALLRWRRPLGAEAIGPDIFIPAAERFGLSGDVATMVFDLARQDIPVIAAQAPDFYVSLNLAPSELCSGKGRALTQRLLEVTGRDPKLVFIELTERGLLEQNAKERIEELRALGVRIAIDDFGTGYSSLAYLASFSLDYLKLDKLFTQGIADKGPRRTVAIQIVELARSLDLDVIAEGVETIEQAMAVSTHGVAKAQGWLYGRAVPLDELLRRLPEGLRPPPRAPQPIAREVPAS